MKSWSGLRAIVAACGGGSVGLMMSGDDGHVTTLPSRVLACRTQHQQKRSTSVEDDDVLALATFVALQSRGMPVNVSIDGPANASFARGEAFYRQRHGQMNLACTNCHDDNYGKRLYTETISQGHGTAFPAYRLEWQTLGSLQRRLRACLFGVRAEMPKPGAAFQSGGFAPNRCCTKKSNRFRSP